MKLAILILLFFQAQPEKVSQALDLTVEGHVDSALVILDNEVANSTERDSVYYQARYLQAWNLKQIGDRESLLRAQEILNTELEQIPTEFGKLRWRMHSLNGNISFNFGNEVQYEASHMQSFLIAKSINDTSGYTLALRNLYTRYSRMQSSKQVLISFIDELKEISKSSSDKKVHFETLLTEAYFESKHGSTQKALELAGAAKDIGSEAGVGWFEDALTARITFFLDDHNYTNAEKELFELLNSKQAQINPSLKYKSLARLVQLYMLTANQEQADVVFFEMNNVQGTIDPAALEIGVYAKMAYKGVTDAYELDPVFANAKESGFDSPIYFLLFFGIIGLALSIYLTRSFLPTPDRQFYPNAWTQSY